MIPWERDIYLELLRQEIESENNKIANEQNMINALSRKGKFR
jgi:hypothetical protein